MRIACPDCNAAYDVPAARLAPGMGVRCVRCGVVWVPVATEDAIPAIRSQPEPEPEPPPPAMVEAVAESPLVEPPGEAVTPSVPEPVVAGPVVGRLTGMARRRPPVLLGWVVTAFVLAGLAYLAIAYSGAIVGAWPAAERAYNLFGLFKR